MTIPNETPRNLTPPSAATCDRGSLHPLSSPVASFVPFHACTVPFLDADASQSPAASHDGTNSRATLNKEIVR